ncbi:hypothetical protein BX600DRAFT_263213 [Xylariales sp. PMI_506]|nr:hypothetical protein BX600DRAFT_263213 [Xylariales sp. PMI_506]
MSSPVWFITGASNGFGLILCLRALRANHRVVGSVRSKSKSPEAVKQIEDAGGKVIELDMTESKDSITRKIKEVGQIDYLVNNAGYSILGACETFTESESQTQMQTNFFGPLFVIQAALEGMRARSTGTIVNVSSVAAKDPQPTCAVYSASKAALEGMSESLAGEVAPFNISVLIVEPGAFRTNFLSASMFSEEACPLAYNDTPVRVVLDKFKTMNGKQAGDPDKGVERIFEAITGQGIAGHLKGKVLRLVIGDDALTRIRRNNAKFVGDLEAGESVTKSTDY